jgi:pilus assembly protein CpaE
VDQNAAPPVLAQVVSVLPVHEGAGASTVATNVACLLAAASPGRVLLVELDAALGQDAAALGLRPTAGLAQAAAAEAPSDLARLLSPHESGLVTLLAAGPSPGPLVRQEVHRLLGELAASFDRVVVDLPAAFDDGVLAALARSELVVVVASAETSTVEALALTLETLDLLDVPRGRLRVVLNRTGVTSGPVVEEVERVVGSPVAVTVPPSGEVPAATAAGRPVALARPRSAVAAALRAVAAQLER